MFFEQNICLFLLKIGLHKNRKEKIENLIKIEILTLPIYSFEK